MIPGGRVQGAGVGSCPSCRGEYGTVLNSRNTYFRCLKILLSCSFHQKVFRISKNPHATYHSKKSCKDTTFRESLLGKKWSSISGFRCSNSTLLSKGTECGRGTDTEPLHGPVFLLPEIGFCREGMQGDRLWNIAWSKGTKPSFRGEVREGSPWEECVNWHLKAERKESWGKPSQQMRSSRSFYFP